MEPTFDLASCLASIPDRRRAEGKMYGQVGVILFSIIAMLSGSLHVLEGGFADEAIVTDALDVKQTSVGYKADLAQ